MSTKFSKKGFSLIELSIVLIIIGLLVAGITGGASLIKSAELRSVMTEARGYKMAVNAYYTAQDYLPGDDPTGDNGTDNDSVTTDEGNNNGRIEAYSAQNEVEGVEAWNDMSDPDIGIVDMGVITLPTVTAGTMPALGASTEMGNAKYKAGGWTFDWMGDTVASGTGTADISSNVLLFTRSTLQATVTSGAANEIVPNIILSGIDAASIDKKMDDGAFTTGSVFGLDAEDATAGTYATSGTDNCIASQTAILCAVAFKIDL